jgi:hypothetical protein
VVSYVDRFPAAVGSVALVVGKSTFVTLFDEGYSTLSALVPGNGEVPVVDQVVVFDHDSNQLGEVPGPGATGETTLPERYWSLTPGD